MDRGDLAERLLARRGAGSADRRVSRPRRIIALVLFASAAVGLPADAGHEMPFYPSYYPQEITVEVVPPASVPARLLKHTLHAYLGPSPWPSGTPPKGVTAAPSLGSYVVVTLNPKSSALSTREARCATAARIIGALTAKDERWTYHPYPVTPHHPDYLQHVDQVEAARAAFPRMPGGRLPAGLRLRARGALAESLLGPGPRPSGGAWDAIVEEISVRDLVSASFSTLHGGIARPWAKEGWYHAHRLFGDRDVEAVQRLATTARAEERMTLERRLVAELTKGCERVIAGYTVRHEMLNDDYSAGVENVAADSATGLLSAVFLRTVKLKDFPWNGWLTVGVPERPTAAWNPIGGFSDVTGRLLWAALGDPAFFPAPHGSGWIENRVRVQTADVPAAAPLPIPKDAVLPEAGTGLLKPVGDGKTARAKITYRILTSAFHDGTKMTPADALYGLAFGFAWGGGRGAEHDRQVERATALAREWLLGIKLLRVETDVLRFGDIVMKYEVPIVEAWLARALPDPTQLAVVGAPWSTLPWPLLALLDEAARRGIAAFSAEDARRRGLPWLDLVRDPKQRDQLSALAAELESRSHVPPPLRGFVTEREARARWAALRQFVAERRHFLVTNGPYELHAWTPSTTVLRVFRDFSYPLGVGSWNRLSIPLRGTITRTEVRPERLEVWAEAQRVERFARDYRLVTEPVGSPAAQKDKGLAVALRYVVVTPDGAVARTGALAADGTGMFVLRRDGIPPGSTYYLAPSVNDNHVAPEVKALRPA